jgi:hypothetical protein
VVYQQVGEKSVDAVILSEAKDLLVTPNVQNKSRFFSPAKNRWASE